MLMFLVSVTDYPETWAWKMSMQRYKGIVLRKTVGGHWGQELVKQAWSCSLTPPPPPKLKYSALVNAKDSLRLHQQKPQEPHVRQGNGNMKVGIFQVQRKHPHTWSVLKYRRKCINSVLFHEQAGIQPLAV